MLKELFIERKMNRRSILKMFVLGALSHALPGCSKKKILKLDLTTPEDNLLAFIKTRGSLDEDEEVVYWWTGNVYAFIPEEKATSLFQFEGYNICKMPSIQGGYAFLSREASFYKDINSGDILETWVNPFTTETVNIVHVWNDPVNHKYLLKNPWGMFSLPYTELGDKICWHFDIFPYYPSPLPRSEYPEFSQSDIYQGAEMFQFYVEKSDLNNAELYSAPADISWTRIGPWLPWMKMGDRPGHLVYQCRGMKLKNGYSDLPIAIQKYVETHNPKFKNAPEKYTEPNETSWTYFKKMLEKKKE